MKIIIEYRNTKRKIEGPFNICGSRADLYHLANLIVQEIHRQVVVSEGEIRRTGFSYGWVSITDPDPRQERLANTEPLGWDE